MKSLPKGAKKLNLSRETIRGLTADALSGAVGGINPDTQVGCPQSAAYTCTGCAYSGKLCSVVNGQSATATANSQAV